MTAVKVLLLLLKGTYSEVLSWPENIENMQTNPSAVSFGGSTSIYIKEALCLLEIYLSFFRSGHVGLTIPSEEAKNSGSTTSQCNSQSVLFSCSLPPA